MLFQHRNTARGGSITSFTDSYVVLHNGLNEWMCRVRQPLSAQNI